MYGFKMEISSNLCSWAFCMDTFSDVDFLSFALSLGSF